MQKTKISILVLTSFIICFLSSSCNEPGELMATETLMPTYSPSSTEKPILTPTKKPSPSLTPTPTITTRPTRTATPVGFIGEGNCGLIRESLRIGKGSIQQIKFSPNDNLLSIATSSSINLFKLENNDLLWSVDTEFPVGQVRFGNDTNYLTGLDSDGAIHRWAITDGKLVAQRNFENLETSNAVFYDAELSPDGNIVAFLVKLGVQVIHIDTEKTIQELKVPSDAAEYMHDFSGDITFSPDGQELALYTNSFIFIWRLNDGELIHQLSAPTYFQAVVSNFDFSPSGKSLVIGLDFLEEHNSLFFDVDAEVFIDDLDASNIVYSPEGSLIVGSNQDGVSLYSSFSRQEISFLRTKDAFSGELAFSSDGSYLAVGTNHGVEIWNVVTKNKIGMIPGQYSHITSMVSNGYQLVLGHMNGISIWNQSNGEFIQNLPIQEPVFSVSISADGNKVAFSDREKISLWQIDEDYLFMEIPKQSMPRDITLSPDGQFLAAAIFFEPITVWDTGSKKIVYQLTTSEQISPGFSSVIFSQDGHMLAAMGSVDKEYAGYVTIWSSADGEKISEVSAPNIRPSSKGQIAFSADGSMLGWGGAYNAGFTLPVIPPNTLETRAWLADHFEEPINSVVFSPNRQIVAIGGYDGEIRIFITASQRLLCSIGNHPGGILELLYSLDGKTIISLGEDGTIRYWSE